MTRSVQYVLFFSVLYSAVASASPYDICLKFATGPGQPVKVITIDTYCVDSVPSVINLNKNGEAYFIVHTSGGIFEKCGYVHSSATFEAVDDKGNEKLKFEFYKPWGGIAIEPKLTILTPNVHCYIRETGPMAISCPPLATSETPDAFASVPLQNRTVSVSAPKDSSECIWVHLE